MLSRNTSVRPWGSQWQNNNTNTKTSTEQHNCKELKVQEDDHKIQFPFKKNKTRSGLWRLRGHHPDDRKWRQHWRNTRRRRRRRRRRHVWLKKLGPVTPGGGSAPEGWPRPYRFSFSSWIWPSQCQRSEFWPGRSPPSAQVNTHNRYNQQHQHTLTPGHTPGHTHQDDVCTCSREMTMKTMATVYRFPGSQSSNAVMQPLT